MAKDLPYFKFNVAEFLLGRISTETSALKGVFIDACAHYWHKECCMSKLELNAMIGKRNVGLLIDKGYIKEEGLKISIPFLNEQFLELIESKSFNSKNGKKGAEKRWGGHSGAIAGQWHLDKDKIRGDKEQDKKAMIDKWFIDLENSSHLETIASIQKIPVDEVRAFIPAFRLKAELEYQDYNRFVSHFKNFINTEKNATTNKSKSDRINRQESVSELEELARAVLRTG